MYAVSPTGMDGADRMDEMDGVDRERWWAVTFATPEFEVVAGLWWQRVVRLGGNPIVVRRRSTGRWEDNTGLKPGAILEAMAQATGSEWVLYMDADADLLGRPEVPAGGEWDVGLVGNPNPAHRNRIAAACLFVRQSVGGRKFLEKWQRRCQAAGGIDHPRLTETIRNSRAVMVSATGWVRWVQNGLSLAKPGYASGEGKGEA
jgi:hypothetical protein